MHSTVPLTSRSRISHLTPQPLPPQLTNPLTCPIHCPLSHSCTVLTFMGFFSPRGYTLQDLPDLLCTLEADHNVICKQHRPQTLLWDLVCQRVLQGKGWTSTLCVIHPPTWTCHFYCKPHYHLSSLINHPHISVSLNFLLQHRTSTSMQFLIICLQIKKRSFQTSY